ncbi:hypothetical protein PG911_05970 [Tenacibaculum ovolyticum]|uniref:hypothetical protein n=1 Tax=Tenacibaculum ovolyticum TaxID=104270 RepID=UPI0022F3FA1C|nr:hypothetical protein [Tenacibaculum ovolyticum]WBX77805.1 hypothetical protein PG911_05970 [Tenacibaculum ovolyticum]
MRKVFFLLLVTVLVSCKTIYHSYIYDIDTKTPIENVKIYDTDSLVAKTDKHGYFKLKKIKGRELTFKKENYKIVTIPSISTQNGEFIEKSFIGDTIFLIHYKSKYNKYYENQ